jgi:N-acetylmuramate 1-kinase
MPGDPTKAPLLAVTLSETQLQELAVSLAGVLVPGDCVALRGALGAGKTTFARALVRALLNDPAHDVPSPTFALRQDYAGPRGAVVHLDLYRVTDVRELDELGFEESAPQAITIIEWPERAEAALPPARFEVRLQNGSRADVRHVTLTGFGAAAPRVSHVVGNR